MELDRADLTLLEMLQCDGRTTVQALSEAIHLSARATLNRVRKLESAGLIEGYRALINRAVIGEQISVFAEIALKDQRQAAVRRYDYLVRIACPHLAHYHKLISGWLDDAGLGVEKIVTNIELQTIKEFAGF